MPGRYLIRFDDFCPTMDREKWAPYEALMDEYAIRPIVAIVPDNKDPKLAVAIADEGFWEHMRGLQAKGWAIGLHGFQHVGQGRGRGLVPFHRMNEFVGLPEARQREKLEGGMAILRSHGLEPTVWVAPRHGFDRTTLGVLQSIGIRVISDGLALFPYNEDGMMWLPQQLWRPEHRKRGIWTICIHVNSQPTSGYGELKAFLQQYSGDVISVDQARREFQDRKLSIADRAFRFAWLRKYQFSKAMQFLR